MQLVLPVTFSKQNSVDTWVKGPNAQVLEHLKQTMTQAKGSTVASQRICFIDGVHGVGKTHLLLAIHEMANKQHLSHQYLNLSSLINMPVQILEGVYESQIICIDDVQSLEHNQIWQTGLFDLINQFVESNNVLLLLASTKSAHELALQLPDLRTRLTWGTNFTLKALSDNEKIAALSIHARALGISFQDDALKFLISRASRNMHELMSLLQELDRASLQDKRKLTIPFIKSVMKL